MPASTKQLTIRGVSPELAERLSKLSKARNESVNTTVLRLLEEVTGVDARHRALEKYVTWSKADVRRFDDAIAVQRVVDRDLWE